MCGRFTPAERNYSVGEQELLAVVDAMRTWRCYLEGVTEDILVVVTNHNPLTYLQAQSVLFRRQTRWSECLQMLTFRGLYRSDPLSRNPGVLTALLPVAGAEFCAGVQYPSPCSQKSTC